ncbi:Rv3654c family TadE-like protein [Bifidobacterium aesculapii]|uniref:Rv3654c family TadE-like protein n=1 Tax=Bifidobacterium aesculapii TaxID=1329411 RepID=UPI001F41BB52|nr:Rv3654c family TadE-like protein [Bifidobacterium aesculapii]
MEPHAESHVESRALLRGGRQADEGSGTLAGVALIMLAAALMSSVAVAGRLLTVRAAARSAADLAALSAAVALRDGAADPCMVAGTVASAHAGNLASCTVGGELGGDVTVSVGIDTRVPFMPHIVVDARAGPVPCAPAGTP